MTHMTRNGKHTTLKPAPLVADEVLSRLSVQAQRTPGNNDVVQSCQRVSVAAIGAAPLSNGSALRERARWIRSQLMSSMLQGGTCTTHIEFDQESMSSRPMTTRGGWTSTRVEGPRQSTRAITSQNTKEEVSSIKTGNLIDESRQSRTYDTNRRKKPDLILYLVSTQSNFGTLIR
ncbi:hypothetical protein PIIN_05230 [Serendipita indica DSM 11827]|uniref:Uncharacterized protein n=1 Tax=Serendipita indica (strain DSM 11827) TaxID=1109443 RepID=G4TIY4_SERID|nr:hypothetical protein PIIN_05230 [Serendipita indica DSM 11827]